MSNEELTGAGQNNHRDLPASCPRRRSPPTAPSSNWASIRWTGSTFCFAVESEFNINIPDDAAQSIRSVRDVVDGIDKLLKESPGGKEPVRA